MKKGKERRQKEKKASCPYFVREPGFAFPAGREEEKKTRRVFYPAGPETTD